MTLFDRALARFRQRKPEGDYRVRTAMPIRVTFSDGQGNTISGEVFRGPWGHAGNLSIRTDTGRVYVRLRDAVRITNSDAELFDFVTGIPDDDDLLELVEEERFRRMVEIVDDEG